MQKAFLCKWDMGKTNILPMHCLHPLLNNCLEPPSYWSKTSSIRNQEEYTFQTHEVACASFYNFKKRGDCFSQPLSCHCLTICSYSWSVHSPELFLPFAELASWQNRWQCQQVSSIWQSKYDSHSQKYIFQESFKNSSFHFDTSSAVR